MSSCRHHDDSIIVLHVALAPLASLCSDISIVWELGDINSDAARQTVVSRYTTN